MSEVSATDVTAAPLTTGEEVRLHRLEDVVERGLNTFVEVGRALAAIRDGRLYRTTHSRFARDPSPNNVVRLLDGR